MCPVMGSDFIWECEGFVFRAELMARVAAWFGMLKLLYY